MSKRYYWLKLKADFFSKREIKKLRKIAGGDTYTIIYLKLQLLSLKDDGKLYYDGFEDDFISEMALELDEEIDNVKITLLFLQKHNLIEQVNNDEYLMTNIQEVTGSEVDSAKRVRKLRASKLKALQCNNDVTKCNIEKEKEKELKKEKNNIIYSQIFDYWNSCNITIHKKITAKTKTSINNLLKDYDISDILKSIENYKVIYHSKNTFFSYKWTLEEFLKRDKGMPVFLYKTEKDYLSKSDNKKQPIQFESLQQEATGEITFS